MRLPSDELHKIVVELAEDLALGSEN